MKKQLLKLLDTSGKNETLAIRTDRNQRKKPESVKNRKKVDKKSQFTRETNV